MSGRTGVRDAVRVRRDRIRANPRLGFAYRAGVALLGTLIVIVGVILLPFPGPGWLVIFIGLGVLASEFAWASRWLDYVKERVAQWTAWVGRQSPLVRTAMGLATLAIIAAAVYGYHQWRGLPGWIPGIE